ncbi:DUF6776 family protein [Sphaerotilus uruguayifluvii]|uniref:Uncharacterized protein n=1 Tax=Sphaerotilus uruguayifluvii TaxID=2735897 RepID=A0ABX2G3L0_9BURK|nr:DUF6776 family protein [Leptothrix sp. C29]NRT56882.1 hypothetical protein [Leptothrix sp. C29]
MRWKLLRRRLSVSAPRVTVRSRLPWPLRWLALVLMMAGSAAMAVWAVESGREAGALEPQARAELVGLREEVRRLREEHERAVSVANAADSLLKAAQATQEALAARVKALEAENLALTRDLGFFEKMMPASGDKRPLSVRGLQLQADGPQRLRYQALLMLAVGQPAGLKGRYDLVLTGTQDGRAWTQALSRPDQRIDIRQYQRLEGLVELPAGVQVRQLEIRVLDAGGKLLASEIARL